MSDDVLDKLDVGLPPQAFKKGPFSSSNIIGEVTEAVHRLLLDTYDLTPQPPRIEEDLKFTPKDREEVIYIYMYRAAQNGPVLHGVHPQQVSVRCREIVGLGAFVTSLHAPFGVSSTSIHPAGWSGC